MTNCENFLNDEKINQFFLCQEISSTSFNEDYKKTYQILIEATDSDRRKWLLINEIIYSIKKTQPNITSFKNVFSDYVTGPKKISNLLNFKFSLLGELSGSEKLLLKQKRYTWKTYLFRSVTEKECFDATKSIGKYIPLGPSLFPAWALEDASPVLSHHPSYIVSNCIKDFYFPKCLNKIRKKAQIIPLFKKSDLEEPNNYRPISIIPCLSKRFEALMRNQINDYFNVNRIFSRHQYGFMKKRSTIGAKMYEFIIKETDENKFVTAAFLDLYKAFNSIYHEILSIQLANLGSDISALKIIGSFLSDRVQSVLLNDIFSDSLSVERGLPQGTVLVPLLFYHYINDMHEQVDNKTELFQYADDTVVFTFGYSIQKSKNQLSSCAMKLTSYFKLHQLSLNASRTEFIIFSKIARKNQKKLLYIDGALVEEKQEIKYLGVHIDNRLTFQSEAKFLLKKRWLLEWKPYTQFATRYQDHH